MTFVFNGLSSDICETNRGELEDYRERDKIRDAELALMKEKLSIVISSLKQRKQRLLRNILLNFTRTKRNLLNMNMPWHL